MRKHWFLGMLGWAAVSTLCSYAKPPTGALNGIVLTSKGRPAASAQVFWQAADGTSPHILHADAHGRFRVSPLRDGLYDLRAESAGTWSEWEHNLIVRNGRQIEVTLRLLRTTPPSRHVGLQGRVRKWPVPLEDSLPHDAAVDPQGHVWLTLMNVNQLARLDPVTGEWKFLATPAQNAGPHGRVSDADGNLWFTESSVGKIGRVDAHSNAIMEFTVPCVGDPQIPMIGPDGALRFAAEEANSITRMDMGNGQSQSFALPTPRATPSGIAVGPDGAIWFC